MPPFAILIGDSLTVGAACNAGSNLGHLMYSVPQTVAIDPQILPRCSHQSILT